MTQPPNSTISAWFTGRLPDEWVTTAPPHITVDRDEITVTIELDAPKLGADASADDVSEAFAARMTGWREDTREHRMNIARHAEHRFERKVAWAVRCGDRIEVFNNLAAPVMTRLRQPERLILDTLVEANIARSRADAVAWCVRLVGTNAESWLHDLRTAMRSVEEVRAAGPDSTTDS